MTDPAAVPPKAMASKTARKDDNPNRPAGDDGFTREYVSEKDKGGEAPVPDQKAVARNRGEAGPGRQKEFRESHDPLVVSDFTDPSEAAAPEAMSLPAPVTQTPAPVQTAETDPEDGVTAQAQKGRLALAPGGLDISGRKAASPIGSGEGAGTTAPAAEVEPAGGPFTANAGGAPRTMTGQNTPPADPADAPAQFEAEASAPAPVAADPPEDMPTISRHGEGQAAAQKNAGAAPHLSVSQQRGVVVQVAHAVSGAEGSFEIALDPAELGNVRLILRTSESGMNVQVLAERPVAIDLLRRNIAQLEAEFRELGFSDIDFEFSQQHHGSAEAERTTTEDWWIETSEPAPASAPVPGIARRIADVSGGLDLRL